MKNKTMTMAGKGRVDEKLSELAADEHGGIFIGKHHKDIKGIIGKLFGSDMAVAAAGAEMTTTLTSA